MRNLEGSVKDKVLAERDIFTKEREDWDIFTMPFYSLSLASDPTAASTNQRLEYCTKVNYEGIRGQKLTYCQDESQLKS